jgi:hypothetical protein
MRNILPYADAPNNHSAGPSSRRRRSRSGTRTMMACARSSSCSTRPHAFKALLVVNLRSSGDAGGGVIHDVEEHVPHDDRRWNRWVERLSVANSQLLCKHTCRNTSRCACFRIRICLDSEHGAHDAVQAVDTERASEVARAPPWQGVTPPSACDTARNSAAAIDTNVTVNAPSAMSRPGNDSN